MKFLCKIIIESQLYLWANRVNSNSNRGINLADDDPGTFLGFDFRAYLSEGEVAIKFSFVQSMILYQRIYYP